MPLYDFKCPLCGTKETFFRKVEDRDNFAVCDCGSTFQRVLSAPYVRPEIQPYLSPNGRWITSRAERRDDLSRSNAIEWEPGIEEYVEGKKKDREKESFASIERAVDDITTGMVSSGKLSVL